METNDNIPGNIDKDSASVTVHLAENIADEVATQKDQGIFWNFRKSKHPYKLTVFVFRRIRIFFSFNQDIDGQGSISITIENGIKGGADNKLIGSNESTLSKLNKGINPLSKKNMYIDFHIHYLIIHD